MGQIASQPSEEEDYEPRDGTPKKEQVPNDHPLSDDLVFSSQINSSTNSASIPPQHLGESKYSSSPALCLRPSQPPTPIPRCEMPDSSPAQSLPALGSSADLAVGSNNNANSPQLSKKKRRHKRRSSASHLDEDHQPPIPHSPIDLDYDGEHTQYGEMGDVDVDINTISASSVQARSQHKKDKKASKRAAKRAKRQARASSALQPDKEQSRFHEIWVSQERRSAAKREPEEVESEAHVVELTEPDHPVLEKRRRKSQSQAENESERISKKHEKSQSGTANFPTQFNEQANDDAIDEPEVSNNGEINLNDLAEQLYSSRKRKFRHEVPEEPEPAIGAPVYEETAEVMDVDARIESDLIDIEAVESTVDSEVEEVYRDDDIDDDYTGENDDDCAESTALEARSTSHIITTRRASASMEASREPTDDTRNGELVSGVVEGEVADHEEQNGAGIDGGIAPNDIDGSAYDVEVPSSMPHLGSVGETSTKYTKRRTSNKTSTGRKRVAKPDFFSRMVDDIEGDINSQSSSTAGLSRRSDKGKQTAVSEDEAEAGPPIANGKARQPKIISMLKDSPYSYANGAMTPSTESVVHLRTPKTTVTLSGPFSEFEIRNLTQAINRFRDQNDMTQLQINELIHSNPKEPRAAELWECIVATCPGRSRRNIIKQTRRRFHNFVARGTWTPEQDQELKQMYEQYGNKYTLIGQFINRHPEDIRDRIRNYIICGDKLRKNAWSQDEADRLVAIVEQAIVEIRQQRATRGLDNSRPVEEDINWQLVSQGMGRIRSRLQCISKWKAMKPQLAGGGLDGEEVPIEEIIRQARETATTMSYRNRSLVIKEILKSGANADARIPWLKLRNELGGQWTRPPLMIVWFRLRRTLPSWQSMTVKETCTLLIHKFQQTHKLEYPDEENSNLDYDVEYREIEHRIKKGRKSNPTPKSAAFIDKASNDEAEEENGEVEKAIRDQLGAAGGEAAEEERAEASHGHRHSSVDLSIGNQEREVEDSEPEANTRRHPRRRFARSSGRRFKPRDLPSDDIDDRSSDTNASQVSSIPAR